MHRNDVVDLLRLQGLPHNYPRPRNDYICKDKFEPCVRHRRIPKIAAMLGNTMHAPSVEAIGASIVVSLFGAVSTDVTVRRSTPVQFAKQWKPSVISCIPEGTLAQQHMRRRRTELAWTKDEHWSGTQCGDGSGCSCCHVRAKFEIVKFLQAQHLTEQDCKVCYDHYVDQFHVDRTEVNDELLKQCRPTSWARIESDDFRSLSHPYHDVTDEYALWEQEVEIANESDTPMRACVSAR